MAVAHQMRRALSQGQAAKEVADSKGPGRVAQGLNVLVTSLTFALPTRLADGFGRKVALLAAARFTPHLWFPRSAGA